MKDKTREQLKQLKKQLPAINKTLNNTEADRLQLIVNQLLENDVTTPMLQKMLAEIITLINQSGESGHPVIRLIKTALGEELNAPPQLFSPQLDERPDTDVLYRGDDAPPQEMLDQPDTLLGGPPDEDDKQTFNISGDVSGGNVNIGGKQIFYGTPEERGPDFFAYPDIRAPQVVPPEEVFEVVVGFSAEAPPPAVEYNNEIDIRQPSPDDVILVDLTLHGAELARGDTYATLALDITATATFECRPLPAANEIVVKAVYLYGHVPITTVWRGVRIQERTPTIDLTALSEDKNSCVIPPSQAYIWQNIDLIIQIDHQYHISDRLTWKLRSPHFNDITLTGPGDPEAIKQASRLDDDLNAEGYEGRMALNMLKNYGNLLAEIIPDEVFKRLDQVAKIAGGPPSVLLLTEDPNILWELAYLEQPLAGGDGHPQFLGAQVRMGRWYSLPRSRTLPPHILPVDTVAIFWNDYLGNTRGDHYHLAYAEKEQETIAGRVGGEPRKATYAEFVERYMFSEEWNRPNQWLHFVGHGESHPDPAIGTNLKLVREADFDLYDLLPLKMEGGIFRCSNPQTAFTGVFLNACQLAVESITASRPSGFPSHFIRRGAGMVISTAWKADDELASTFADTFYKRVFKERQEIGKVMMDLRREADLQNGKILPLAYIYMGHPGARAQVGTQEG